MSKAVDEMPILVRREVEARVIGPIMTAFIDKMGRAEALAVLRPIIEDLARESGRTAAKMAGGDGCKDLARAMEQWAAGGAYDQAVLELTDKTFNWDVHPVRLRRDVHRVGYGRSGLRTVLRPGFRHGRGFQPQNETDPDNHPDAGSRQVRLSIGDRGLGRPIS